MKKHLYFAAVALAALPVCANATSETGKTPSNKNAAAPVYDNDLKAVGDRIRQTGHQLQADIRETLRKARAQRAVLEARQADERKKEAERARQQAIKDAAALAAAKEAKQRQALEAAQAQARKEAAERAAKVERERQAALQAQRALEEKLAKEQQASKEKASKASKGKTKLGEDTQFGVDI